MLSEQNFSLEHIEEVRGSRKVDKTILERSIYALGLLEALARVCAMISGISEFEEGF